MWHLGMPVWRMHLMSSREQSAGPPKGRQLINSQSTALGHQGMQHTSSHGPERTSCRDPPRSARGLRRG